MTYSIDVDYVFKAHVTVEADSEQEAVNKFNKCSFEIGKGIVSPFPENEVSISMNNIAQMCPKSIIEEGVLIEEL